MTKIKAKKETQKNGASTTLSGTMSTYSTNLTSREGQTRNPGTTTSSWKGESMPGTTAIPNKWISPPATTKVRPWIYRRSWTSHQQSGPWTTRTKSSAKATLKAGASDPCWDPHYHLHNVDSQILIKICLISLSTHIRTSHHGQSMRPNQLRSPGEAIPEENLL